ncbi:hypothetical protein [Pseudanabaena mucicola]|uniref:hypothetical protein n=1 Tax=Pseudanabaena mucicola TaxID=71190 RepID=UPI002577AEF3|nr:hypothetical protein [Pseudanabaena mucicola]
MPAAESRALEINAECLLVIDGVTYLGGKCNFKSSYSTDFFQNDRLLITCPDGRSAEDTFCGGAQQRIARQGVFGYLYRDNGIGSLCWNQLKSRRAEQCFEGLKRQGACWSNPSSRYRDNPNKVTSVRFCVWAR